MERLPIWVDLVKFAKRLGCIMGLEENCGCKMSVSRRKKGLILPHSLDHLISKEKNFEKPGKHFLNQRPGLTAAMRSRVQMVQ